MKTKRCVQAVSRSVAALRNGVGVMRSGRGNPRFRVYSVGDFRAALERERARADRNGHCVSVVLVRVGEQDHGALSPEETIQILARRTRLTDEVGWFDRFRLGVLSPYTSPEDARSMVEDLCRLSNGRLSPEDCGIYGYPWDDSRHGGNGDHRGDADEDVVRKDAKPLSRECLAEPRGVPQPGCVKTRAAAESGPGPRVPPCRGLAALLEKGPALGQRGLDFVCASLGLVAAVPIWLVAGLMIKIVSPGPVLLRQTRIGQGGKPFVMWKLRTMNLDADPTVHQTHVAQLIRSAAEGDHGNPRPMAKLDSHPDLIVFGNVLRKLCIDELPQLINVLRGEMSLVGPRPAMPYEVKEYLPWQKSRLDALPGMTGLWQVSGKNRLTFNEMVRLDIQYARQQSVWLNVRILSSTPRAILRQVLEAWGSRKVTMGELDHA